MRVLFYTAAAVAACIASVTEAIRIESNEAAIYDDNTLAQSYLFEDKKDDKKDDKKEQEKKPLPKPALSQQEKKKSQDQELVVKAIEALHTVDGVPSNGPAP